MLRASTTDSPSAERGSNLGFVIGGMCFAVASTPLLSSVASGVAIALTYVIGAVFFTCAAFLQLRISVPGWAWRAAIVQFVGTLYFNVDTGRALLQQLDDLDITNLMIWRPEVFGSACFLVASWLAFLAPTKGGGPIAAARGSHDWWVAGWNLLGSILFGVSTVTAFVVPSTDEPLDAALMNLTTCTGALCFVVAAAMGLRSAAHAGAS